MAIIRAVSGLCSSLGIASTAEGVETPEQLRLVTAEECTEVQGYLFSRPIPGGQIPQLLQRLGAPGYDACAPLTPQSPSAHIERPSTAAAAEPPLPAAADVQSDSSCQPACSSRPC
jgi:hypothetical protein